MKLLHLADLHLGKIIYGVSLIDNGDQPTWVDRLIEKIDEIKPDAIMVAGDVFDRSAPKDDAYQLLDHLITEIQIRNIPLLVIAGNHDSGIKLQHLAGILEKNRIYISGKLEKKLKKITLEDEYGRVNFYLLPYIFPNLVAKVLEDESIKDYNEAMKTILDAQDVDFSERNVLIAHQNVVANGEHANYSGSETMVGGSGEIDYHAFDGFDYVALGHIHSSYSVGREGVRYAGSPLCYHFNEIKQKNKGPILVDLKEKGTEIKTEHIVIEPLHKMREIKDTMENIQSALENNRYENEYLKIVITDKRNTPSFSTFVRNICNNHGSVVMELVSAYREFKGSSDTNKSNSGFTEKPIEEYFRDYYRSMKNDVDPSEEEEEIINMVAEIVNHANDSVNPMEPDKDIVDKVLNKVLDVFQP